MSYKLPNKLFTRKFVVIVLLLGLTAGIMALLFRYCSQPPSQSPFQADELQQSNGDTLDVGIEISPLLFTFGADSIAGLDYELIRAYADSVGRPIKFHPLNAPTDGLVALSNGDLDMVISSFPSTSGMKDHYGLTDPVYLDRQVLVQRLGAGDTLPRITDQRQLAGDTVYISKGSPMESRVRNLAKEIGDTIVVIADPDHSAEQLFIQVALGNVRQAVMNEAIAKKLAADYPAIDISTPISFTQFQTWATNKNDSLFTKDLNRWLEQYKQTPAYHDKVNHYLK